MDFFVVKNKNLANEEFVIYEKETKDQMYGSYNLYGILSKKSSKVIPKDLLPKKDEDNYIFEALGNSCFSRQKILIPEGYKKTRRTEKTDSFKWLLRTYLQPYIGLEKIKLLNQEGYEINKWIEQSRKYWITIKDIDKLKPNEKIKLLVLDRNVGDLVTIKKGQLYKPETFFVNNSAIYWKCENDSLAGKIKYKWQESESKPYDLEFDIEYETDSWYPLTNGILPAKDSQGIYKLLGKDKNWSEFPKNTPIGWRGPMILWSDLKKVYKL